MPGLTKHVRLLQIIRTALFDEGVISVWDNLGIDWHHGHGNNSGVLNFITPPYPFSMRSQAYLQPIGDAYSPH